MNLESRTHLVAALHTYLEHSSHAELGKIFLSTGVKPLDPEDGPQNGNHLSRSKRITKVLSLIKPDHGFGSLTAIARHCLETDFASAVNADRMSLSWGDDNSSMNVMLTRSKELQTALRTINLNFVDGKLVDSDLPEPRPETGWERVDRVITKNRMALGHAANEEDFQSIGLLARELLITIAQAVYLPGMHENLDEVTPSNTDARRMLENFVGHEVPGGKNEDLRRHIKSTLKLAVALQHRRTASRRDAALCLEATSSLVNIIRILHDASPSHL